MATILVLNVKWLTKQVAHNCSGTESQGSRANQREDRTVGHTKKYFISKELRTSNFLVLYMKNFHTSSQANPEIRKKLHITIFLIFIDEKINQKYGEKGNDDIDT